MKYERWAVTHDVDTHEAVLLVAAGDKYGFVFGKGEHWPDRNDLPDVPLDQSLQQIEALARDEFLYGVPAPSLSMLAARILFRKVRPLLTSDRQTP